MKRLLATALVILAVFAALPEGCEANDIHVVFLNPGSADDIGVWGGGTTMIGDITTVLICDYQNGG